jgi:hypothetical protein
MCGVCVCVRARVCECDERKWLCEVACTRLHGALAEFMSASSRLSPSHVVEQNDVHVRVVVKHNADRVVPRIHLGVWVDHLQMRVWTHTCSE